MLIFEFTRYECAQFIFSGCCYNPKNIKNKRQRKLKDGSSTHSTIVGYCKLYGLIGDTYKSNEDITTEMYQNVLGVLFNMGGNSTTINNIPIIPDFNESDISTLKNTEEEEDAKQVDDFGTGSFTFEDDSGIMGDGGWNFNNTPIIPDLLESDMSTLKNTEEEEDTKQVDDFGTGSFAFEDDSGIIGDLLTLKNAK